MNWKGESAGKSAKHKWLNNNYGKPSICENLKCKKRSNIFEWCLKKDREYSHNRKDYLRMCRSCHRKYDMTEEKKQKAIENLWWKRGIPVPGKPNPQNLFPHPQNLWWNKDKKKMKEYYEKRKQN